MTDQEWYALIEAEYELVAHDLQAQGYTRIESHDFYKWHYTKPGSPTLVIVHYTKPGSPTLVIARELGGPNWWAKGLDNNA
jgi:hypothetical protein